VSHAKTAELTKMLFETWKWVGPRNQIPPSEGEILKGKGDGPGYARTYLMANILPSDSAGDSMVQMLIVVHIDDTWRIRLNHLCAVAMQPYVKLL